MPNLLQIAQLGHPVIRKKARVVKDVLDRTVQKLIDDMIVTVQDVSGIGIAAPQVYQSLRVFILASHPNPRYPKAPTMKPTAVINPVIVSHSKKMEEGWEGCLSIPGIRARVPRYISIDVEYTMRNGKRRKITYNDFIARIFQHELDHLDGVVFLDRLKNIKSIITEKEYQKLIR